MNPDVGEVLQNLEARIASANPVRGSTMLIDPREMRLLVRKIQEQDRTLIRIALAARRWREDTNNRALVDEIGRLAVQASEEGWV